MGPSDEGSDALAVVNEVNSGASKFSLSAEGYLETADGTISAKEIAGLLDSDETIRLFSSTVGSYDKAACTIDALGVFSC